MNPKISDSSPVLLLVEDSEADITVIREALSEASFPGRLHVVRNGVEALDYLRKEGEFRTAPSPDLVLLDLNLPKLHGLDILAEIRGTPRLTHLPVVVLTTSENSRDVTDAYRLHANCYLRKPSGVDEFFRVIREISNFWLKDALPPPETGK